MHRVHTGVCRGLHTWVQRGLVHAHGCTRGVAHTHAKGCEHVQSVHMGVGACTGCTRVRAWGCTSGCKGVLVHAWCAHRCRGCRCMHRVHTTGCTHMQRGVSACKVCTRMQVHAHGLHTQVQWCASACTVRTRVQEAQGHRCTRARGANVCKRCRCTPGDVTQECASRCTPGDAACMQGVQVHTSGCTWVQVHARKHTHAGAHACRVIMHAHTGARGAGACSRVHTHSGGCTWVRTQMQVHAGGAGMQGVRVHTRGAGAYKGVRVHAGGVARGCRGCSCTHGGADTCSCPPPSRPWPACTRRGRRRPRWRWPRRGPRSRS